MTIPFTTPTETELQLAARTLKEFLATWPVPDSLEGRFPTFLGTGEGEEDESAIHEIAEIIGCCQPKHCKLGSRMIVQIMLRMAIRAGVVLGLIIAEQRRPKGCLTRK